MNDQTPGQDEIITAVKTIQGLNVYEGQYVTDSSVIEKDASGIFIPYATISFGTSFEGPDRGISSTKLNTYLTNCTVWVVAPDDRLSRVFQDKVRAILVGFEPSDATPLRLQGGYNYADTDMGLTRYVHSTLYAYQTNISY